MTVISEYNEYRLSLLIAVNGPDGVWISVNASDVQCYTGVGIYIPPNGNFTLSWVHHGELVWQIWYAANGHSSIITYEWFNSPAIGDGCLTPIRTRCETQATPRIIYHPDALPIGGASLRPSICSLLRKTLAELRRGSQEN